MNSQKELQNVLTTSTIFQHPNAFRLILILIFVYGLLTRPICPLPSLSLNGIARCGATKSLIDHMPNQAGRPASSSCRRGARALVGIGLHFGMASSVLCGGGPWGCNIWAERFSSRYSQSDGGRHPRPIMTRGLVGDWHFIRAEPLWTSQSSLCRSIRLRASPRDYLATIII